MVTHALHSLYTDVQRPPNSLDLYAGCTLGYLVKF